MRPSSAWTPKQSPPSSATSPSCRLPAVTQPTSLRLLPSQALPRPRCPAAARTPTKTPTSGMCAAPTRRARALHALSMARRALQSLVCRCPSPQFPNSTVIMDAAHLHPIFPSHRSALAMETRDVSRPAPRIAWDAHRTGMFVCAHLFWPRRHKYAIRHRSQDRKHIALRSARSVFGSNPNGSLWPTPREGRQISRGSTFAQLEKEVSQLRDEITTLKERDDSKDVDHRARCMPQRTCQATPGEANKD